jgi:hypothetical protein
LFLAEAHYDADLLEREFLEVFDRSEDKGPISLLLNWFIQLRKHGRIPEDDVEKLERIYEDKEEVKTMLLEALAKERKELAEKIESTQKTEFARKLLMKGFDLPLIAELTDLSEAKILQLKQEMEN